jgi:hypothetical protein
VRREYGIRDGRLDSAVTRVALTRAISELPEGYRAIFLLHEVDGYQHREIAQLLGCSVGNSKSQLHKAKLKIRDFLSQTDTEAAVLGPAGRDTGRERSIARRRPVAAKEWQTAPAPPMNIGSIAGLAPPSAA